MSFFDRFSTKDLDAFAKKLAEDIAKRYPPEMEKNKQKKISVKRVTRILEEALDKAKSFKVEKKLGVYKKARLGNNFKWELDNLGYSKEFVETATEGMVVYLTRKEQESEENKNETA